MYKFAILIIIIILILWFGSPILWFGAGYVTALITNDLGSKITGGYGCSHKELLRKFNTAPSGFKHEYMVREMFNCFVSRGRFEEVDGKKLSWLRAEDGTPLSLDGYNAEAGVAFEYQGKGHYEDVFNDKLKYLLQRKNDDTKIRLCRENNIQLVIIHYRIPMEILSDYIKSRLYDLKLLKSYMRFYQGYINPIAEPPRSEDTLIKKVFVVNRKGMQLYKKKN